FVHEVRERAGYQHHHAHDEDPDQELHFHRLIVHAEENEGDQGHAGHAVGLETVGAGAHGIASVVAGTIGDHAGIARVVFLDLEDDLHQVGADVGDLGEDTAGNPQRRRAQRFADREPDKAWTGVFTGDEEQNAEHDDQLHANQQHADTHPGFQGNVVNRIR